MARRIIFCLAIALLCLNAEACFKRIFSIKNYKSSYMGCFADKKQKRDLQYKAETSDKMTLKMCNDLCKGVGAKYYGLQSGSECYCGPTHGEYGKQAEEYCDRTCLGDMSSNKVLNAIHKKPKCGGDLFNSVYEVN